MNADLRKPSPQDPEAAFIHQPNPLQPSDDAFDLEVDLADFDDVDGTVIYSRDAAPEVHESKGLENTLDTKRQVEAPKGARKRLRPVFDRISSESKTPLPGTKAFNEQWFEQHDPPLLHGSMVDPDDMPALPGNEFVRVREFGTDEEGGDLIHPDEYLYQGSLRRKGLRDALYKKPGQKAPLPGTAAFNEQWFRQPESVIEADPEREYTKAPLLHGSMVDPEGMPALPEKEYVQVRDFGGGRQGGDLIHEREYDEGGFDSKKLRDERTAQQIGLLGRTRRQLSNILESALSGTRDFGGRLLGRGKDEKKADSRREDRDFKPSATPGMIDLRKFDPNISSQSANSG